MAFMIANLLAPSYVLTYMPGQDHLIQAQPASLNSDDQKWEMLPFAMAGSNYGVVFYNPVHNVAIAFGGNNQPLTVQGYKPQPATSVQNVNPSLLWTVIFENNYLRIANPDHVNGQEWETHGDSVGNGTFIDTWNWNNGRNQQWQLYPA